MINKLEIKGYKSIKSLDLTLLPINILIGANGVGKPNFISFFKLINAIFNQRLQNYVAQQGGADNLLHFGRKVTEKIIASIYFNEINGYGILLNSNNLNELKINEKIGFKSYQNWHSELSNKFNDESFLKIHNTGISSYLKLHLSSFKIFHFHDTGENAPLRANCQVDNNKSLKENGSNLAAFLYFLQEKHPKNFFKIEKTIQSIAPYFDRFELQPDRINEQYIKLEWKEINQPDGYFNASHLSDGTLRFIALTTLLMQPNLPKTIIIDEPELGLHPFAINILSGLIKKASAQSQVIIATQSVNFVDNFEPEDIITVDRTQNESIFSRLKKEDLTNWLEDYTLGDLWQKNVIQGQP